MDYQPQRVVLLSVTVVANIIIWMVMIASIGLGIMHVTSCPAQPFIPIYLIVLGVVSLLALVLTYFQSSSDEEGLCCLSSFCVGVLYLFNFCWFIAGTVWVYATYTPSYLPGEANYCHQTLYLFALLFTSLWWAVVGFMFFCGCCFLIMACGRVCFLGHDMPHLPYRSYGATGDI